MMDKGKDPVKVHAPTADDLVFKTSRWQKVLYDLERDHNPGLVKAEKAGASRSPRYADYQRELFARLYNPRTPRKDTPTEGAEWAVELHKLAEEVAELRALQARCHGDEMWSGMGAATVSQAVVAKMKPSESNQDTEALKRRVEALEMMQQQGVKVGDKIAKAKAQYERAKQQADAAAKGLDPNAIRAAIRKACDAAQQEINEEEAQLSALSFGNEAGVPSPSTAMQQKRELANRLKSSTKLAEIAKLAGRLRRVAAEKQRSKTNYAREEINDVEQGDDLARLLPTELMLMADESTEDLFFKKLTERQALQYALRGREVQGRGPVIICMDESGSMSGEPEAWSKAVALALLDVAQRQKRSWCFVHFDSRVSRVDVVKAGAVDQKALGECLEYFTGGGTSFEAPLRKAVELIKQEGGFKKADILLVTDGECTTSPTFDAQFAADKQALEASVFTVLVNGAGMGAAERWSDKVYMLSDMLGGSRRAGEFEDRVFSI